MVNIVQKKRLNRKPLPPHPDLKNLIVHIGTGKTGTTTIQNFFKKNFSLKHSSSNKSIPSNTYYIGLNFEEVPDNLLTYRWQSAGSMAWLNGETQKVSKNILQILESIHGLTDENSTVIWSNESIHLSPNLFANVIYDFASRNKVDLKIIVFVRNHLDFLKSAYLQWGIKHKTYPGPIMPLPEWVKLNSKTLNFGAKIAEWNEIFGDQLIVKNYDQCRNLIAYFAEILSVNNDKDIRNYIDQNPRQNTTPNELNLLMFAIYNGFFDEPKMPNDMAEFLQTYPLINNNTIEHDQYIPNANDFAYPVESMVSDQVIINHLLKIKGEPPLIRSEPSQVPLGANELTIKLISKLLYAQVSQSNQIKSLEAKIERLSHNIKEASSHG